MGRLKPAEFARLIGISRSAMTQIKTGQTHSLKAETAFAIEEKTGYSARWISTGKGPQRIHRKPEDAIPNAVLELAKRIYTMNKDRRELLLQIFDHAIDDDRLGSGWTRPDKRKA